MGLLDPTLPDVDLDEFATRPYRDRIRIMATHWVEAGFGTPRAIHLVYLLKIVGYAVGGLAVIAATTPGIDGLADVATWYAEPQVLVKVVLWTLLWEVLGLGCGFGPLTLHFWPPLGGFLHWARPGTIRLAAFPTRLPFTAGTRRTWLDVALYLGVVGTTGYALVADVVTWQLLLGPIVLLPLAGLRDTVVFLAARAEQYWTLLIVYALVPDQVVLGTMVVMLAVWWGAATSKLNRHFPSVVAVMMCNSPLMASRRVKQAMWVDAPHDLRPSRAATWLAHGGTVTEYVVPAALVLTGGGGTLGRVALIVMIVFHLHIISTFPMGVPLEWNVFVIYAALVVFGGEHQLTILDVGALGPVVLGLVALGLALGPVLGNLRPDLVSFLPAMRYYAGNWPTSTWIFDHDAYERIDAAITKAAKGPEKQLRIFYDDPQCFALLQKAWGWRSLHVSGRALLGLLPRATEGRDPDELLVRDGEWTGGFLLGYNFGDGHWHGRKLLQAVAEQVELQPGDVRIIELESQPLGDPTQRYAIVDAVEGVLEEGTVRIDDVIDLPPWLGEDGTVPVHDVTDHRPRVRR